MVLATFRRFSRLMAAAVRKGGCCGYKWGACIGSATNSNSVIYLCQRKVGFQLSQPQASMQLAVRSVKSSLGAHHVGGSVWALVQEKGCNASMAMESWKVKNKENKEKRLMSCTGPQNLGKMKSTQMDLDWCKLP